ncbi:MAG: hypothetical protein PHW22_04590, partial [Bacilli bacterium]|nr:hypothetical protein [Bacilli bacterium]
EEVKIPALMELANSIRHDDDVRVTEKKKAKQVKKPKEEKAAVEDVKSEASTTKDESKETSPKPKIENFDRKKLKETNPELTKVEKEKKKTDK